MSKTNFYQHNFIGFKMSFSPLTSPLFSPIFILRGMMRGQTCKAAYQRRPQNQSFAAELGLGHTAVLERCVPLPVCRQHHHETSVHCPPDSDVQQAGCSTVNSRLAPRS